MIEERNKPPENVQSRHEKNPCHWRDRATVEIPKTNIEKTKYVRVETPKENKAETKKPTLFPFVRVPERPAQTIDSRLAQARSESNKEEMLPRGSVEQKRPSYTTSAPIDDNADAEKILKQILETPFITDIGAFIASLKAEYRKGLKDVLTKKRIPVPETAQEKDVAAQLLEELVAYDIKDDEDLHLDDLVAEQYRNNVQYCFQQVQSDGKVPVGATVISDPVAQYFESLAPGEKPRKVLVAEPSASLRYVNTVINGVREVKALVDSGSQFVSMKESVAVSLGLNWDPDKKIHMMSANGQVEAAVGTADMVPFKFGNVTFYMQVYIFEKPAYDVLIGRPWDVHTSSVVENFPDGGQKITITDPNTGKRCVIPTFEKTEMRRNEKQENAQGFR
jgi:hypothetical protein